MLYLAFSPIGDQWMFRWGDENLWRPVGSRIAADEMGGHEVAMAFFRSAQVLVIAWDER